MPTRNLIVAILLMCVVAPAQTLTMLTEATSKMPLERPFRRKTNPATFIMVISFAVAQATSCVADP